MVSLESPPQLLSLARTDWQLVGGTAVRYPGTVSEVDLGAAEDDRRAWTEVAHLGDPLKRDIGEAVSVVNGETDHNDVGVRVRQWTKLFVVFLARRIPECELNCQTVHLHTTAVDMHMYIAVVDLGGGWLG